MAVDCREASPPTAGASGVDTATPIRGLLKRWKCRSTAGSHLPLLSRVLLGRGLADAAAAETFFAPTLKHLHDPSLMPGLEAAAARILDAARGGEPIVIYGDYDVDGVTATAILYHTIKAIAPDAPVTSYVPHRLEEGYGLSADAIRELAAAGAKVVVSVDCGITAVEPAEAARAAGIDLVITDHHNLPGDGVYPAAHALVHPRLPGSAYPFGDLCGAGVAYKLAWRLCTLACRSERVSEPLRALLIEMLALASLGVIADVVPLVGENRVIAFHGLRRIRSSRFEGLRALVEASGLSGGNVSEEGVGFSLAPRLNACGRMGHAREAVELLTTATGARAAEIAEQLTLLNEDRRRIERRIFDQACDLAEAAGMTSGDRRAIVLAHADWHAGVVGIVCSRLVERFGRPVILMCSRDGVCHGSGRSIDGYSLHAGLHHCAGHLTTYGGHDMAAGLKLNAAGLNAFVESFMQHANDHIAPESLMSTVGYDTEASLHEITLPVTQRLLSMAPFGQGNPSLRLRVTAARVAARPTTMGKENKHMLVQLETTTPNAPHQFLRTVGWNWAQRIEHFPVGRIVDVLLTPKVSEWQGRVRLEAELIDVRE